MQFAVHYLFLLLLQRIFSLLLQAEVHPICGNFSRYVLIYKWMGFETINRSLIQTYHLLVKPEYMNFIIKFEKNLREELNYSCVDQDRIYSVLLFMKVYGMI
jgi:hypothetical protein